MYDIDENESQVLARKENRERQGDSAAGTPERKEDKISPVLMSNMEQLRSIEPFILTAVGGSGSASPSLQTNVVDISIPATGALSSSSNSSGVTTLSPISPALLSTSVPSSSNTATACSADDDIEDLFKIQRIVGYKYSFFRGLLYWLTVVLSAGTALLVYYWFQTFYMNTRYKRCDISQADYFLIHSTDRREICRVHETPSHEKYIVYRFSKFFYNPLLNRFDKPIMKNQFKKFELNELIGSGLGPTQVGELETRFSKNVIDIPVKSIPQLLLEEVLHPFFIFQLYSVLLWFTEEYYYYAVAIFIIASVSAILNLKEIRDNLKSLRKISYYSCPMEVLRGGVFEEISSIELVPGDVVRLKTTSQPLPCDFTLLAGTVILNESMLTGESIPVTKYSVLQDTDDPGHCYHLEAEKRSLLYGGTVIVKLIPPGGASSGILAMVRQTAFDTSKGRLILSILFPKKSHFKFLAESMKFIGVLCGIAMIGFAISVWRLYSLGQSGKIIVIRALDLITIVIPPALPMAMTVGTGFALNRLKKSQIFCISPPRLNMAGKIQVFCFDKTGTLTEEGLDLMGLVANRPDGGGFTEVIGDDYEGRLSKEMKLIMTTCHSLSNINGEVTGDPLECKIFHAFDSTIQDELQSNIHVHHTSDNSKTHYIERFDFQSKLQRMSVIVRHTEESGHSRYLSLVKGSPEMVQTLCIPETLPADYQSRLSEFTVKGYRVLACGFKNWNENQTYSATPNGVSNREQLRNESESNLSFLGFIVMENKMKPESPGIISVLHQANIKTIMVTGDNPLTALSVSQQTGIIKKDSLLFMGMIKDGSPDEITWEHLTENERGDYYRIDPTTLLLETDDKAMSTRYNLIVTGPVFKRLYTNYLATGSQKFTNMLRVGLVYARMTPDEKQILIEEIQRIGLYVGMCGDGANDCGALKAAHVGISLSETEASIAAPFTSTVTNISCCPTLIKEGRASLAVSFKLFQFMGMYSLVQFTSVIFLYFQASVLGNWMYLYQDLFIIFLLVIFMGMNRPSNKLSVKRPSGRLISGAIIGSLVVHVLVCIGFQFAVFFLVQAKQVNWDDNVQDEENIFTFHTTSLFIYGSFQYLIMALTFSHGKPFLKPMYSNLPLFITYLVTLTTTLLLLFVPNQRAWTWLQLLILPVSFRFIIFALVISNLVANLLVEFIFYYYKTHTKKKKNKDPTIIFSKDVPKDNRITEDTVLLPFSN